MSILVNLSNKHELHADPLPHSFFCGQMHVFRPRTDLARCLLAFFPLLCAALIAISRLDDYRHDVYDVTVGATLGMLIGWFSYRRYYPPLRSLRCDAPYDKADIGSIEGFSKLDDEEQAISRPLVSRQGSGVQESYQMELAEMSSPG